MSAVGGAAMGELGILSIIALMAAMILGFVFQGGLTGFLEAARGLTNRAVAVGVVAPDAQANCARIGGIAASLPGSGQDCAWGSTGGRTAGRPASQGPPQEGIPCRG